MVTGRKWTLCAQAKKSEGLAWQVLYELTTRATVRHKHANAANKISYLDEHTAYNARISTVWCGSHTMHTNA